MKILKYNNKGVLKKLCPFWNTTDHSEWNDGQVAAMVGSAWCEKRCESFDGYDKPGYIRCNGDVQP